jgi:hypothetical protein
MRDSKDTPAARKEGERGEGVRGRRGEEEKRRGQKQDARSRMSEAGDQGVEMGG